MNLLKTFKVKEVKKVLDEENKEKYVLLYLDTNDPNMANTQNVVLQEYTTNIRNN
jgi:hypothetical protein